MIFIRIAIALILMASTALAQVEYDQRIKEKQWYRPDTTRDAYTFRNIDHHAMVKIGNRTRGQAEPSFTLTRWENINTGDAAYCKIWLDSTMGADIKVNEDSSFTINNKHRLYMKSETEFEWEMILYERPKTPSWTFQMESENVDYKFQAPLEQWEIDEGCHRPENVDNSHALYHDYKGGGLIPEADSLYKIGKMTHLYRFWAKDANSDKIWLDQIIVDGKLTVDGPLLWFEKAILPITIGPTFGYSDSGASTWEAGVTVAYQMDATVSGGALDSITACFWAVDGVDYGMALYDNTINGSVFDGALLDTTNLCEGCGTETYPWRSEETLIGYTIETSTVYWLAVKVSSGARHIRYDDDPGNGHNNAFESGSPATWTDPWDGPNDIGSFERLVSFYATYDTDGAPAATNRRQTIVRSE